MFTCSVSLKKENIVFLVRRRNNKGIHCDIKWCGFLRLILHWSKDRYTVAVIQGIMWSMQETMRFGALCVTSLPNSVGSLCCSISLCWSSKLSLLSKLSNKFYVTFCYVSVMLISNGVAKLMLTSLKLLLYCWTTTFTLSIFLALSRCTDNSF